VSIDLRGRVSADSDRSHTNVFTVAHSGPHIELQLDLVWVLRNEQPRPTRSHSNPSPAGSSISQPVHVVQAVKPKEKATPDQSMDLDKILEEMQRKNETLKRLHQLKAENEAMELALV
jgi:hypothetical protein